MSANLTLQLTTANLLCWGKTDFQKKKKNAAKGKQVNFLCTGGGNNLGESFN